MSLDVVQLPLGPIETNCYLVRLPGAPEAVVVDPSGPATEIRLELAGGSRGGGRNTSDRIGYERTDKTNYPKLNLAAFVFFLGVVALIVGLSIGLSND